MTKPLNRKRVALVLAVPIFYLAMVLLAQQTGWVVGTTSNAWANGVAMTAFIYIAAFGVFLALFLCALLICSTVALWKWIHD